MALNHFILNYQGNKFLETKKHLLDTIDYSKYDYIVEPFCGIFGFSRAIASYKNFNGKFILNDIDTNLIDIFKRLKDNPNLLLEEVENELLKYKTDKELSYDKNKSCLLKLISQVGTVRLHQIKKGITKINNYKLKIEEFNEFFKRVEFFNLEFNEFIKHIPSNKKCLVYCDPPYLNSDNNQYQKYLNYSDDDDYRDGTSIYIDIKNLFENKCENWNILLVINKLTILDYLFKNYTLLEYSGFYENITTTFKKKNKKKHIVYYK